MRFSAIFPGTLDRGTPEKVERDILDKIQLNARFPMNPRTGGAGASGG